MSLRNYYEQLVSIGERLYENENGIFDEDKTYYFKTISDRADRLCAEINLFRENLVRLREAYQARLDEASDCHNRYFSSSDAYNRLVRNELRQHARADLALRLSCRHRNKRCGSGYMYSNFQKEKTSLTLDKRKKRWYNSIILKSNDEEK